MPKTHRTTTTLLAGLLAVACGAALAQAPAEPARPISKGEEKAVRDFKLLDANGDGRLSRSEVALVPRLAAAFDDADTNHDGYVDMNEIRAFAVVYRAQRDARRAAEAQQHPPLQQQDSAQPQP